MILRYGNALKAVVAGEQLPPWEYPAVITACREAGADPLLVKWKRRRPGLVALSIGGHGQGPQMAANSAALEQLKEAVSRAKAELYAPPRPGETKHVLPLPARLDADVERRMGMSDTLATVQMSWVSAGAQNGFREFLRGR